MHHGMRALASVQARLRHEPRQICLELEVSRVQSGTFTAILSDKCCCEANYEAFAVRIIICRAISLKFQDFFQPSEMLFCRSVGFAENQC